MTMYSVCCDAPIKWTDICSKCNEHTDTYDPELCEHTEIPMENCNCHNCKAERDFDAAAHKADNENNEAKLREHE